MSFLFVFHLTSSGHIGRKMTQLKAMVNQAAKRLISKASLWDQDLSIN